MNRTARCSFVRTRSFPKVTITSSMPGLTVLPVRATRRGWAMNFSFVFLFSDDVPEENLDACLGVIGQSREFVNNLLPNVLPLPL